jgi:DNA-directed RNA polymerase subunit M/transcription elongation factor TFIIS
MPPIDTIGARPGGRRRRLPETDERRCPSCQSRELTRMGYLILSGETVTEEFLRCEPCGTPFLFVRKAVG